MFARQEHNVVGQPAAPSKTGRSHAKRAPDSLQPASLLQRSVGNSRLGSWGAATSISGVTRPRIQRQCGCGGGCSTCGKKDETKRVQSQLTVGPAHDVYEQEADRVADSVMRMPETSTETETHGIGESIQRITAGDGGGFTPSPDFQARQDGGQPLSASTRRFMEPRFGVDFGQVRIHTDAAARDSAAQIQARAYTVGHHITLGNGASENDRHLMAHELTHVVQQGGAGVSAQRAPLSSRIQRDPPPAANPCPDGVKTVNVDLISLRGASRNAPADLDFANTVYAPCCVQFQMSHGVSVIPSLSDTWLGGDTAMSRGTTRGAIDPEQTAAYDGATREFGLSGRIRAFYVESLVGGSRATSFPANWATGAAAPYEGMVIVTNGGATRSLAHEIGHILLDADGTVHTTHPGGTGNIMEPTDSSTGSTLDASQCPTIFSNA
jgi:Domain of unknown function (DUF4157)